MGSIVERVEDRQQLATQDIRQPRQQLVDAAARQLWQLYPRPQRAECRRPSLVHRHQRAACHEAVHLVGRHLIITEAVQDDEQMVTEVIDLGQIEIIDRVPHRNRVELQTGAESRQLHQAGAFAKSAQSADSIRTSPRTSAFSSE
jgi:hypothetical protein